MRLTGFVYHLSICTMTFLFPYSMFEQKVYSSHIGVTQCGIFCWPFSNLFVLLITRTGRLFYVVNDPWTCPWLEESLGVYWISSFVLKYAFFWLSALSDHVDLLYWMWQQCIRPTDWCHSACSAGLELGSLLSFILSGMFGEHPGVSCYSRYQSDVAFLGMSSVICHLSVC